MTTNIRQTKSLLSLVLLTSVLSFTTSHAISSSYDGDSSEQTLQRLNQQIAKQPKNAKLYLERGQVYFSLREFDGAIEDYTAAITLDNQQYDAWFWRGMAQGRVGNVAAGIEDISVYIEHNPNDSRAHTKRGVRYLWLGDRDNASKDFHRAIELDPKNAEAHDDLGVVLAQQGDYQRALEHFYQTVQIDSSYQKGYHNLAMALYIMNRDVDALQAVDYAIQLDPEARNSMLLKSEILSALGRHAEAQAAHENAMFLPEGNWTERAPVK